MEEQNVIEQPQVRVEPITPVTDESYVDDLINSLSPDLCTARIISPAYSARNGELTAVLQYMYQSMIYQNLGNFTVYSQLQRIGVQEMKHLEILGRTLLKLGVLPIYSAFPPRMDIFFSGRYVNYNANPRQMITLAISGETNAIKNYNQMISKLENQTVRDIIIHIRNEEEEHLRILTNILSTL